MFALELEARQHICTFSFRKSFTVTEKICYNMRKRYNRWSPEKKKKKNHNNYKRQRKKEMEYFWKDDSCSSGQEWTCFLGLSKPCRYKGFSIHSVPNELQPVYIHTNTKRNVISITLQILLCLPSSLPFRRPRLTCMQQLTIWAWIAQTV
jgi:hypothetical protein